MLLMMKLISMNIRGLGGRIKRKYISDLIKKNNKLDLSVCKKQNVNILVRKGVIKFGGQMKSNGLRLEQLIMVEG